MSGLFSGKRILFVSKHSGFISGLEHYLYLTARILRSHGAEIWFCYEKRINQAATFEQAFDHVTQGPELPDEHFDLAAIHSVATLDYLRSFLSKYGERSALFFHNSEYLCPRQNKLLPITQHTCQRRYHPIICGFCGMSRHPSYWNSHFADEFRRNFVQFKDRFEYIRRRFPRIVVLSSFMRNTMLANGFSPDALHVIQPAIPAPPEIPARLPTDTPRILYLGRMEREKGVDILIQVLAGLKHDFRATIAGDGSMRKSIEKRAERLGLKSRIEFCPYPSSPESLIAGTDILLMPSLWKSSVSMPVAESGVWGVPSVAFQTRELPDMILDGRTGYCVPVGNIEGMTRRVDELLGDFELRTKMGANARAHILEVCPESRMLRGYQRLLD